MEDLKTDEVFLGLINRSTLVVKEIKAFTEIELVEKIEVVRPWIETSQSRYEYLQQLVNRGTYHRGQVVTISRNAGITDAKYRLYIF